LLRVTDTTALSVAHPLQPEPYERANPWASVYGVAGMKATFITSSRWGFRVRSGIEEVSVAKEDRGFASMDRQKQREIASKGGKAAHAKGTAHEWTSEEAREAGRKGGMASHRRRKEQSDGSDDSAQGSGSGMSDMSGQSEQIR
jgi:general stress protein YciG